MPVTFYTQHDFDTLTKRIEDAERKAGDAMTSLHEAERMRPHWAKGYSSDSIAAQCATAALQDMWDALGVASQTEAIARLRKLTKLAATYEEFFANREPPLSAKVAE